MTFHQEPGEPVPEMSKLVEHLAVARRKIIKARKQGLSFDPKKALKIPSLIEPVEWKEDAFKEFGKKVNQAKVVVFTILPGVDDADNPNTLIVTSLWGEIMVIMVRELVKYSEESRKEMEGWAELKEFFARDQTAYITEREEQVVIWMKMIGIELDEASATGLETWHPLSREFCPSVAMVFGELWGHLTAPFRGTESSGWVWNYHTKEESAELAPDQARLAFAISNAMVTLTLDGVAARIDPEDARHLEEMGMLIVRSEQEGILESEETLGMRALRLEGEEDPKLKITWGSVQTAYREPFGRLQRAGVSLIQESSAPSVLSRKKEVIEDLVAWEEAISFVTLLGPQHKRPVMTEEWVLPDPPKDSILKNRDQESVRRANERLGLDPDDLDYARERLQDYE